MIIPPSILFLGAKIEFVIVVIYWLSSKSREKSRVALMNSNDEDDLEE